MKVETNNESINKKKIGEKIEDILYLLGANAMVIFIALVFETNVIEMLNPILKAIIDMILGIAVLRICKKLTKIIIKDIKEQ